jgi:hypothetical protein
MIKIVESTETVPLRKNIKPGLLFSYRTSLEDVWLSGINGLTKYDVGLHHGDICKLLSAELDSEVIIRGTIVKD